MKSVKKLIGLALLCAFVCGLPHAAESDEPKTMRELLEKLAGQVSRREYSWPFDMTAEPVPMPTAPGPVNLRFTISPNMVCDEIIITVTDIDNLEYMGETSWIMKADPKDTVTYDLPLVIPANDTSGLRIIAGCGKIRHAIHAYFLAYEDSVHYYFGNPRWNYGTSFPKAPKKRIGIPDSVWAKEGSGRGKRSYIDASGNRISEEEYQTRRAARKEKPTQTVIPRDSTLIWMEDEEGNRVLVDRQVFLDSAKTLKRLAKLEKMRKLEETPLTDKEHQVISVDGKLYERHRGEYKFHEMETTTDRSARFEKKRDSLRARAKHKKYEVILDLRDPKDYEFASSLIDSLISTEEPGFYRAVVPFELMEKLRDNGIEARKTVSRSREKHDNSENSGQQLNSVEDGTESHAESGNRGQSIFFEGFEGSFPGTRWSVWDDYSGGGYDYWGAESCRSYSGTKSVWCSGEGNMPPCQYYDWDMLAYMDMIEAIDLTNHTNVTFSFRIWSQLTETTGDECDYYYSPSPYDSGWTWLGMLDRTSNGWEYRLISVDDEWDSLYLSFLFFSGDESTEEDGVFIDHIHIMGDPIPKPNLTYGTPSGWDGPIVPSSVEWTHTVNTLYTNQPTYIDYAVRNTGDTASDMFTINIYIDDILVEVLGSFGVAPGEFDLFEDYVQTIYTPGDHVIRMEIDPWGQVEEENEDDNIFVDTFTWVDAPVYLPNLTYTTPSDWDAPIVPSDIEGTNTVGELCGNQLTYVDWAVLNNGTVDAGPFTTLFYVDDVAVDTVYFPGLDTASTELYEDYEYIFDTGFHTLRIEIDYGNDVQESNENDNVFDIIYYWELAEISVEGEVFFQQLRGLPFPNWYRVRGFRVELWDADSPGPGDLLGSGYTDDWGEFALGPVSNIEEDGTRQDIYIRVYAENDEAVVGDDITPQYIVIPFYITSDTVDNVLSGLYRWMPPYNPSIDADTVESGFFYIAHVVRESYNKWDSLRPYDDPGQTQVLLMEYSPWGTWYSPAEDLLVIEAANIPNTWFPDTFDKDVILHEFGHRIHFSLGFFDAVPTGPPQHSITTIYSPEFAVREAFGDFWSAVSRDSSIHRNSFNSFLDTAWVNYENVEWGQWGNLADTVAGSANTLGKANEGAVAGIFWDIYDEANDDYSGMVDWGDTTRPHHPDDIEDTLWNGIDNILITLLNSTGLGHRPDNIDEFWQVWRYPLRFNHLKAMVDIWYEHGEPCCNDDGMRGDVDYSGGSPNVGDLSYLVAFLFTQPPGPAPPCFEEGDVNATGSINVDDLSYLVDYLFGTPQGPPPPPCP